jgi:hypothetical protein
VRNTYLRNITTKERNTLHLLIGDDPESGYRAKIILLKDDGYTVPEIRKITNHHDNNIRKWIHRFNEKGIEGIISKIHKHKSIKFTDSVEKQIVEIATKKSTKTLWIAIFYMVIACTGWIYNERDETGR